MTSFSDFPLSIPNNTPKLHDTFEAKYVTHYLEEYVDSHVYNGQWLRSRIRLDTQAHTVEKIGDERLLQGVENGVVAPSLRCERLGVASGLTSSPVMPNISPGNDWTGRSLYHRDSGLFPNATLAAESACKNITIAGGGKSAADMVYASVKAEKKNVNWIIRKTGEGPRIFINPAASGW